jgi:hypothetical protein
MLASAISSTVVVMGAMDTMSFSMFAMCAIDSRGKKSDIADEWPKNANCEQP